MALDPILWAMKDAPVADVEEYAVLGAMAEAANDDGCNAYLALATIAERTKLDEQTVRRRQAAMQLRGLLVRGDQEYPPLLKIRADRRPTNYDLMIPHSWWGSKWERMNGDRVRAGRPPLDPEERPDLAPPPPPRPRADKGRTRTAQARADKGRARTAQADGGSSSHPVDPTGGLVDTPSTGGLLDTPSHGVSSRSPRGIYKTSTGYLADTRPTKEEPPLNPKPDARSARVARDRGTRLPEDWTPSPVDVAVASADAPDVDQDREFRRFRDHWLGSSGRNAVKVRWDTAYRNWMREAQDRLTSRPGRPAPRVTAADERLAAGRDLVARLEAKEAAEAAAARATVTDVTVRAITEAQGGLF